MIFFINYYDDYERVFNDEMTSEAKAKNHEKKWLQRQVVITEAAMTSHPPSIIYVRSMYNFCRLPDNIIALSSTLVSWKLNNRYYFACC